MNKKPAKQEGDTDSIIESSIEMFGILLGHIFYFVLYVFLQYMLFRWLDSVCGDAIESVALTNANNSDTKTSDVRVTTHNLRLVERMADEFVSRHGMSGPLASALGKIKCLFCLWNYYHK